MYEEKFNNKIWEGSLKQLQTLKLIDELRLIPSNMRRHQWEAVKEHKKRDFSHRLGYWDYEMREAWNLIMDEDHKSSERRWWSQWLALPAFTDKTNTWHFLMPRKCLVNVVVLILGIFQIRTREVRNFSDVHFNSTFLKLVETASQPTKELSIISALLWTEQESI